MWRAFLITAIALIGLACATAVRLEPVTAGSAADPNSHEPPPATMSQTLRPEAPPHDAPARTEHEGHAEGESMPSAIVYTCPMHPEVRSDVRGTCPKCGMKLAPVKPASDPGSPE